MLIYTIQLVKYYNFFVRMCWYFQHTFPNIRMTAVIHKTSRPAQGRFFNANIISFTRLFNI